jgi:O-antigen ligase
MNSRFARLAPALLALVFPVLNTPLLIAGPWSGRYVLVILLGGLAVPILLAALLAERTAVVLSAAAFLAWATLSTAVAHAPAAAFWGSFVWGTGLVYVAALVTTWLVGSATDDRGRSLTEHAFLVAVAVNAAIAVAQVAFNLEKASLDLKEGRAFGLQGNAVYLACLMVGGLWLVAHQRTRLLVAVPLTAAFAAALQVSGARSGVLVAVVGLAVAATRSWRRAAVLSVALGAGLALAGTLPIQHVRSTTSATARLAEGSGGVGVRLEAWMSATHAIADRPLTGAGPGRFQAATSRYRTLKFARLEGPGRLYRDAHNLLVEYATTTGIVGVACLIAWLAFALRRTGIRTPLAAAGAGMLLIHLVEPQSVGLTPVAFLLIGAAPTTRPVAFATTLATRLSMAVAGVASFGVAAVVSFGFFAMNQATLDFDAAWGRAADRTLPPWSDKEEVRARIRVLQALEEGRREDVSKALPFRRAAANADPEDPFPLEDLAAFELQLGLEPEASAHLARVLELNPWAPNSLTTLGSILADNGDVDGALVLLRRSLLVVPDQPETRALVRRLEHSA